MPTPPLSRKVAEQIIAEINKIIGEGFKLTGSPSAVQELSRRTGVSAPTLYTRLKSALRLYKLRPKSEKIHKVRDLPIEPTPDLTESLLNLFRNHRRRTLAELATATKASTGQILDGIEALKAKGANIHRAGDTYEIPTTAPQSFISGAAFELVSRPDNTFLFGAAGDLHAASKYTRWDVRNDLYERFAKAGVQCSFDTGNWIDGEASFNRYDIESHGLDAQCRLLAAGHPKSDFPTYAVWGDDHEGWYATREGIDVGKYCESIMRTAGHQWNNLGFMEAHVNLRNYNTGTCTTLSVVHPGGGSSYALSYSIQKIIECVPLNSEILTKQGWKKHNEVSPGDTVMGYNINTDKCEWTTITAVHQGRGEVIRYHDPIYSVECTPNHRWALEREQRAGPNKNSKIPTPYKRKDRLLTTIAEAKNRSRIIQAAIAPEGPGLPLFGRHDWLHRSDLATQRVLIMTSGERRAFIEGMLLGEGTVGGRKGQLNDRMVVFCQKPGFVNDAFRLACFMEGIATSDHQIKETRGFTPCRRVTLLSKRKKWLHGFKKEYKGEQDVWCVTTGLGTWVMRQGTTITITGNSYEGGEKPAVALYGHYHKMWAGLIRNVWCVQTGCQQDQTPFMRKKRIEAHIGGTLIHLEQDPDSGSIVAMAPQLIRYFNQGFYQDRWSKHGPVVLPERKSENI